MDTYKIVYFLHFKNAVIFLQNFVISENLLNFVKLSPSLKIQ